MYTLISKLFQKSVILFDIILPPPSIPYLFANFSAIHEQNGKQKLINKIKKENQKGKLKIKNEGETQIVINSAEHSDLYSLSL